ncbi:pentatricopeptide repeat-containing protein At5g56310-like [Magnolia sinica]|uniref:pentatricopeptide repeat-containing protein At5g56310-like n=1 Tax=Magnolia sinica TaxID=86752 RepID=UPI002659E07E|nr:pentatricopeptide repeat-containing protein At5g56310-like [Magnolia sinica]
MRRMDIPHDSFSLTFTLKACSCHQSLPHGEQIHTQVVKTSYSAQAHVHSALMHMYVECRRPQSARKLFDEIPVKSPAAWCVMITLYAEMGELDSCRGLFEEMPHRDVASWNAMIDACGRCGQSGEALRLFREMRATGLRPNHITILGVISACGEMGDLEFGRWIHANYIDNNAFKCNSLRVSTTLIDMYSKCGHVNLAMDVFRSINAKDVLSWTAIICCMAINGRGDTALALFNEMVKAGVRPDEATFIVVLCACSHMGLVEEGHRYFESMTKDYGLVPRIEHYGCMVDIMGRAGHIEQVRKFIENMPMEPNVVVLRSLLGACRVHSAMQTAEWAAKRLEAVRRAGDDDSYVMLSNVYAEDGRWSEVERVRRLMKEMGRSKRWGCSSLHV